MQKNKKLILTAAVSAALFVGGIPSAFAADIPTTYTKDGVTYDLYKKYIHIAVSQNSDGTKEYFNDIVYINANKYIIVEYDDTYEKTYLTSEGMWDSRNGNITGSPGGDSSSALAPGKGWNIAIGNYTSVFGGTDNEALNAATVVGGTGNYAKGGEIVGGTRNKANGGTVIGGTHNKSFNDTAAVFGGKYNKVQGYAAAVFGGSGNKIKMGYTASNDDEGNISSSILGGYENSIVQTSISTKLDGSKHLTEEGIYTIVGGFNSVILGGRTKNATAVGGGSIGPNADDSLAIGQYSVVEVAKGTAIGYEATTNKDGTIAFGHDSGDVSDYTVTWQQRTDKDSSGNIVKNADGTINDYTQTPTITEKTYSSAYYNRLVKIADGIDAHDAVTVEQLNKAVAGAGGGAAYTAGSDIDISSDNAISVKKAGLIASGDTGLVTGGTVYEAVKDKADKSYVDEGLAKKADISYVDQGLSQKVNVSDFAPVKQQVEANTSDISALKTGKADADGSNINVGSFTAKLNTGKVEKGNTGLVSGGTVYDSLQTKADVGYVNTMGLALDSEIKGTAQGLHNEIQDMGNRLTKDINRVGAGSAALAALHLQDFNPDDKWDFAVGYGHYKNANASAVGAFYRPNAGTTVSLDATIGNGDPQVSAGVSFKIGMGKNVEKVVITKDKYDAQQRENQEMKAEIEELKQAIMKMQAK